MNAGITVNPANSMVYQLTGMDANGCQNAVQHSLTVHPLPVVNILNPQQTVCLGEEVSLLGGGAVSYVWQPGGNTQNPYVFIAQTTTQYTLTGTSAANCSASASIELKVEECVGIQDNKGLTENIRIYPNPAKDKLYCATHQKIQGKTLLRLYDALGKLMIEKELSFEHEEVQVLDISALAAGLYFLKLGNDLSGGLRIVKEN